MCCRSNVCRGLVSVGQTSGHVAVINLRGVSRNRKYYKLRILQLLVLSSEMSKNNTGSRYHYNFHHSMEVRSSAIQPQCYRGIVSNVNNIYSCRLYNAAHYLPKVYYKKKGWRKWKSLGYKIIRQFHYSNTEEENVKLYLWFSTCHFHSEFFGPLLFHLIIVVG